MTTATGAALEVTDLAVRRGDRQVLHGVNVTVPHGGWTTIVGPNGAGKSTLLSAVVGVVPYTGTVTITGTTEPALRERARRVGYLPQRPTFPRDFSVLDYALLGRTPHLAWWGGPARADRVIAADALRRLGVFDMRNRPVALLSGGEAQRVALARVLTQQPQLLVLDEPSTGLDIGHAQHLLELIDELRRDGELAVLTTLHDLTVAGQYADTVLMLDGGRLCAQGTAAEVLTAARIAEVYHATVDVAVDAHGRVRVSPQR